MFCRLSDLKNKYVINMQNGSRLGTVSDAQIDTGTAMIDALVIRGRWRLFGLLGREDDTMIRWSEIEVIGEDTILVRLPVSPPGERSEEGKGFFHILTED